MAGVQVEAADAGPASESASDACELGPLKDSDNRGPGSDSEAPPIMSASAEQAQHSAPAVQKYTFFVGPGNNSELVRKTFERRPWWELGKEDDPELNLKWLQCIGRKNELYFNLKAYCEREKIDVHQMAPPTFIVAAGEACPEYQEFARVCKAMENKNRVGNAALARKATDAKGPASPTKGGGGGALGDDAASAASTEEHMSSASSQASAAMIKSPTKAGAKNDGNKSPRKSKAGASRGDAIGSINTAGTANIWIVKPTNNNRGNGIKVFNSFAAIEEHLRKKSLGTQVVVQKYIERPLLYKGRKFDIRQLVLVDNKMNIYVYKEFYVRTSSAVYDIENVQDLFIHLTNYAVQKKKKKGKPERELEEDEMDEEDEEQEEGNNLSMEDLNAFLEEEGYPMNCEGVMKRIHEIIIKVFQSVWKKLDPLRERNTFEVFGWDFLLDEEMNVWVIEVNTNPYIGCSSALLKKIFTGMLEGALRKCVDPHFPPPDGSSASDLEDVEGSEDWVRVYPPEDRKSKKGSETG